ncbi:MAG: hypothetical protein ACM3QS_10835 [Bacteroidota bacterium]
MNVTLIYFSQTGNTRRVAGAMATAFREGGASTRLLSLKKAVPLDALACDLLGIGSPCFLSRAPAPIKRFLSGLMPLGRKQAFVFATSGGAPGRVLSDLSRLLQGKGAEVIGGFLAHGEVHHPAPGLIKRLPDRPNAADLSGARRFALALAEHARAGARGLVAGSRPDTLMPKGGFYDLVARFATDRFARSVLPEPKLDAARCNLCRWCLYECPTHNITLRAFPALGNECIRCYRCLTGCPQGAFRVDWRLANLLILSAYNARFERWFGDLGKDEPLY